CAHGGAARIRALTDDIGYPSDCAVDRKTGDVAVVNSYDGLDPVGSLLIYPHGKQAPREYRSLRLQNYLDDAYDDAGNCYVLGWYENRVTMSELRAGGREL